MLAISEAHELMELYEMSGESGEQVLFELLDLRDRAFEGNVFACSVWIECDLSGSVFRDCDLRGADFSEARMVDVTFERCSMYGCTLPEDRTVRLIGCNNTL